MCCVKTDLKRFGFGQRMWEGAELTFKGVLVAEDEDHAKETVLAWGRYHNFSRGSVGLMPIPDYARNYLPEDYMGRF